MRLVSKELKMNPDSFAPELEVTVRLKLELAQDETIPESNFAEKFGKEFLELLESK
jgi:hypothetical protein